MNNDVFLETMGTRIALRRKELYLTQEQLAEKMGVSLQTISNIELGKKAIRPQNLAKLCDCLEITSDYILYGRRSERQMGDFMKRMSALTQAEYQAVQKIVDLFYSNK